MASPRLGPSGNTNVLLVKYSSSGLAQWAQTLTAGTGSASFYCDTVDSSGNIYAAGYSSGPVTYGFGHGVTATGTSSSSDNVLLVKYSSSGNPQWARTLTSGTNKALFYGDVVDSSGNIYAAGACYGPVTYGFGNGVTATGTSSTNVLLVRY